MMDANMHSLFSNFQDLQTLPQSRRSEVYGLLEHLMRNHRPALRGLGDESLTAIVDLVAGEKDPRNLMVVFSILHAVMVEWDASNHAEALFESVFAYFPITFRPPPNDPYGITPENLKDSLRECIASNGLFAPCAFPQLIDKLDSPSPNVKRDVIQTIKACAEGYGPVVIANYSISLWDSLKFEVLSEQDKEIGEEATQALGTIAATLSKDYTDYSSAPRLSKYINPIVKESKEHFEEPQHKQAQGAARILEGVGSASPLAFAMIAKGILPAIFTFYGDAATISKRRGLLDATLHILDAGVKHQGSEAVSDLASDALLGPYKDQLFAITSQALMGTTEEEVSFRALALKCLRRICSYKQLFSDTEVGLAVQYFNDLLQAPGFGGRKDLSIAAAEALKEVSQARPRLILEITFPALLARLPNTSTEQNTTYLPALEALAQISGDRQTSDTLVRRLFTRIESLIRPAQNPQYIKALLLTLRHVLSNMSLVISPSKADYLQRGTGLIRQVAQAVLANSDLTSMNEVDNMTLLGSVVCVLLRSVDSIDQHAAGHQVYNLYSGETVIIESSSPADEARRRTIFLSTALLAGIDKKISLPYSTEDLPQLADKVADLAMAESDIAIRHGFHQHLALLINKFVATPDLVKVKVVSWLVRKGTADQAFSISDKSIPTVFWTARALLARLAHAEPVLQSLLGLLGHDDLGPIAAHGFAMLLAPEAVMSKENGANVRLLTKQKVLGLAVPQILEIFRAGNGDIKTNCLVALSGLIADAQSDISLLDVEALIPLLLQSLDLDDFKVRSATLRTILAIMKDNPSGLEFHLNSLVARFEKILLDKSADNTVCIVSDFEESMLIGSRTCGTCHYSV